MVTTCLETGWNSAPFDGSALSVDENTRQTIEVVAEARRHGAHVEGEIEGVRGVEDGIGSDEEGQVYPSTRRSPSSRPPASTASRRPSARRTGSYRPSPS